MAVSSNNLIGATRGSAGNITFSSWKGLNVIKNKPTSVANPQTPKQLSRRAALSGAVVAYKGLSEAVNLGFKGLAIKKSAYNAFSSDLIKTAYAFPAGSVPTFSPQLLRISRGSMAPTAAADKEISIPEKTMTFDFAPTLGGSGQALTDRALVGVHNVTKGTFESFATDVVRSSGTVVVSLANTYEALDDVYAYLGFVSADGSKASDSVAVIAQ